MRTRLSLLFVAILIAMLAVTVRASLQMPIWAAFSTFSDHPWAVATLWDAYFGFLTFYVWVAYREPGMASKLLWFVLIAALGNIAMSIYVLLALWRLPAGAGMDELLTGVRR
jgi:hypothetical protein